MYATEQILTRMPLSALPIDISSICLLAPGKHEVKVTVGSEA